MPTIHFQQLYPRASPLAIDLLEKLLNFDPAARITVEQALAHPYLAAYHEEDDEPEHRAGVREIDFDHVTPQPREWLTTDIGFSRPLSDPIAEGWTSAGVCCPRPLYRSIEATACWESTPRPVPESSGRLSSGPLRECAGPDLEKRLICLCCPSLG